VLAGDYFGERTFLHNDANKPGFFVGREDLADAPLSTQEIGEISSASIERLPASELPSY
jgi:hypothetical protein